ncbi:DUF2652 domain-containing protein [Coleofasciculus sp. E2-BRE-01]|uniref:DUF2652 domain-containing protein n=1 Tax=Coleofasciculus sp. E2-BRE-01 TaxID=3069524 RepID=UPI003304E01E
MQKLQGQLSSTPQPTIFIIADISGYTRFMLSNREALLHSQIIISELMRSILKEAKIPIEIAKLEGDAVFMYCLKQGDRVGTDSSEPIGIQELGPKLLTFMAAFMAKLKELHRRNTCDCPACSNLDILRLKIVVHSGEALFYQLDRFEELSSLDVIIVHRLLKNSVMARQYILLTTAAAQDLKFPETIQFQRGVEQYDDLGSVETWVYELPDQPLSHESSHPNHHSHSTLPLEPWMNPTSVVVQTLNQWQYSIWMMWRSLFLSLGLQRFSRLSHLTPAQNWSQSGRSIWMLAMSALRWGISAALLLGGVQLAFPADPQALVQRYIDPETGFISAFFADQIVNRLGISISRFLQIQGGLEIVMAGMNLFWGVHTPMLGLMMGFMFWSFTIANPVVGAISLSRDIALAGFCLAIALTGPAAWDSQGNFQRRDTVLLLLRLSLSYTLIVSALFTEGVMANPLNRTLPISLVLGLGVALGFGFFTRMAGVIVAVWLLVIVALSVVEVGNLYWGLEALKREITLMVGAAVFGVLGRDRWAWPKSRSK